MKLCAFIITELKNLSAASRASAGSSASASAAAASAGKDTYRVFYCDALCCVQHVYVLSCNRKKCIFCMFTECVMMMLIASMDPLLTVFTSLVLLNFYFFFCLSLFLYLQPCQCSPRRASSFPPPAGNPQFLAQPTTVYTVHTLSSRLEATRMYSIYTQSQTVHRIRGAKKWRFSQAGESV